MTNTLYTSRVVRGDSYGSAIDYPTLNVEDPSILQTRNRGVYACFVLITERTYKGVLYYGPRYIHGESKTVAEIYVIDFDKDVYGEEFQFEIVTFLRKPIQFATAQNLQKQIALDVVHATRALNKHKNHV